MGRAKGSIFVYTRELVQQRLGTDGWARASRAFEPETAAFFDGVLLASSWYPVVHWNALVGVVLPMLGGGPNEAMRDLASHIAQQDLSSVYKLVMKLGSPEFLLRRTGQLWSRYYDTGALTPEELGERQWKLTLTAPLAKDAAPDGFTCGPGVTAWVGSGLQLSGTKARVVETRCRFRGATRCEYDVTW